MVVCYHISLTHSQFIVFFLSCLPYLFVVNRNCVPHFTVLLPFLKLCLLRLPSHFIPLSAAVAVATLSSTRLEDATRLDQDSSLLDSLRVNYLLVFSLPARARTAAAASCLCGGGDDDIVLIVSWLWSEQQQQQQQQ